MSNTIATNKQAFRDYHILETVEAGLELRGSEVKSVRDSRVNLNDGFCRIEKNQVFSYNTHIKLYAHASYLNAEATRPRKLLLHRREIRHLFKEVTQKGLALIPLKMYVNSRGFAKIEIALGKGKKAYDHREDVKKREIDRKIRQTLKSRNK